MLKNKKSKPYKTNKKKKQIRDSDTGELVAFNSHKRFPVLSLPEIIVSPVFTKKLRFITNSVTNNSITIQDILNQFMFSVSTISANCFIEAFRVKKVAALAPLTTQGTSVTLSMRPNAADSSNNSFSSVPETYVDTSSSIDVPAYLSLTPSIDTPLGSWHYSSTVNVSLFNVLFPAGTTVDFTVEFIIRFPNSTAAAYTRVLSAATIGVIYGAPILTNIIPVGVNYQ